MVFVNVSNLADSNKKALQHIVKIVQQDPLRMKALDCARVLNLQDYYLAAGFVRNMVWDHIHGYAIPTPLNDIDLVYFMPREPLSTQHYYEQELQLMMPEIRWQVRNQALMHGKNNDAPYYNTQDAMSYWPEKETAVGVRKTSEHHFEIAAIFGVESLLAGRLTPNPKRSLSVFNERVERKQWLLKWPRIMIDK